MKKKILLVLTTLTLVFSAAACSGNTDTKDTTDQNGIQQNDIQQEAVETTDTDVSMDTVSVLNDVWMAYEEDDRFYAVGGDMNHPVENAPGIYSLDDKEALAATLLVKDEAVEMIDEAASLIHGMIANNFTAAAFHLTDSSNADAFVQAMTESIITNQWMCGSPDQYAIYQVGEEYIVVVFGVIDILKPFKEQFTAIHGDAVKILAEENIAM